MMKVWVGGKPRKRSARTTSRALPSKQLEQWKAQIRQGTSVPDADQTRFGPAAKLSAGVAHETGCTARTSAY
jgi:hypothetical protein